MTDDFDPEGYFLADMSEDEKDELIQQLAAKYEFAIENVVELHNAMQILSIQLEDGDVMGHRGETMRRTSRKLQMIAFIIRQRLGIDEEQVKTDAAFAEITSQFDEGD